MRLAIVVGHDDVRPGARGRLPAAPDGAARPGLFEREANDVLGRQIATSATIRGHEARVFAHVARDRSGAPVLVDGVPMSAPSWRATARATAAEVNAWAPDAVLELHFNSVPRLAANGQRMRDWSTCFAYHWPGSSRGEALAATTSAACADELGAGIVDRGALPAKATWSGAPLLILELCRAPAVLLESHNGANYAHHAAFVGALRTGRLGTVIAERSAALIDGWR